MSCCTARPPRELALLRIAAVKPHPPVQECIVCFKPYDAAARLPKLMRCGHTFCVSCLSLHASRSPLGSMKCPLCQRPHPEFVSAPKLTTNFVCVPS